MKFYCIFDDFTKEALEVFTDAGIDVTVHPIGVPRPDAGQMKQILEEYDGVIIGTSQKISEDMFENITAPRIIATASVGTDHICVPDDRKADVTIINTPGANAQSVAEYTISCALLCCKRMTEGAALYRQGKDNKKLSAKPEDLSGKLLGVIGAGSVSRRIMEYAGFLGMKIWCWTAHPENHTELQNLGIEFHDLDNLIRECDVISVNLPDKPGTKGLISADRVSCMKDNCIFISVSRKSTVDINALFERSKQHSGFYTCLDVDVDEEIVRLVPDIPNVMVTPHIAGGTVETRKRMFSELAVRTAEKMTAGNQDHSGR